MAWSESQWDTVFNLGAAHHNTGVPQSENPYTHNAQLFWVWDLAWRMEEHCHPIHEKRRFLRT